MLLRLYYLYEKSAKKVRQLKEVVEDLKEVYNFSEGGCISVRSQGSRWITHKRRALQKSCGSVWSVYHTFNYIV